MQNFQDTFETSNEKSKRSFISVISIFMTVPLRLRQSAVELTLSSRVLGSQVSTSPLIYSLK